MFIDYIYVNKIPGKVVKILDVTDVHCNRIRQYLFFCLSNTKSVTSYIKHISLRYTIIHPSRLLIKTTTYKLRMINRDNSYKNNDCISTS